MDDTMTKTREEELLEEFKAGLSPDDAPQLAARVAELEASRAAEAARADAAERAHDETDTDKASLETENQRLQEQLDAALARAEAAEKKGKGKVAREPAPAKPRSVGPMGDGEALSGTELRDAIADADKIEIAFSDSKQEIGAAEPVVVEGEVWREHTLGLMLKDPVTVKGPTSPPGFSIDGYALLLDGKQVAYCSRPDKLNVAPGQTVSLSDDIFF